MIVQKLEHYVDTHLTQAQARAGLAGNKIVAALYTNQQDARSVVHSHPYHEMILPVSGSEVLYAIDGGLYRLRLGDFIYIPAECYHAGRYRITSDASERLVVQIDDRIWQAARQQFSIPEEWSSNATVLRAAAVSAWDLRGLLERMAQNAGLAPAYRDAAFTALTAELQLLICQITEEKELSVSGTANALVARAAAYLQEHYQEPDLTVTRLAQITFTSREHLSRAFREYTMESVHSYLTNLRMQHCRRALAAGSSVLDACSESGFSNYSSFLKAFRKLYGMTPAEYRTTCR